MVGLKCHCTDYSAFLLLYGNTRISATPELRRLFEGGAYLLFRNLHVRRLIEGGAYSGAALNRGRRLFEQIRYPQNNEMQLSTSMGNKQSCTYAHIAQQQ